MIIGIGESVTLNPEGSDTSYIWSPPTWLSCINCPSPIATPEETITYTVNVTDSNGCTGLDSVTIIIDDTVIVYLPNAFTPDGDDINDVFPPHGFNVSDNEYLFMIFDRWGELLFEARKPLEAWDGKYKGKLVPNDVYIWKLQFVDDKGDLKNRIGNVTVVR